MSGKTNGNVNGIMCLKEGRNLYLIDRKLIKFADGKDQKKLGHCNPRWMTGKANGMEDEDMTELRESIRDKGLLHPLQVARVNGKIVICGGERRKRSIDKLVQDGVECLDPASKKLVPANELYDQIECRFIEDCDDETALGVAIAENETSREIGDGCRAELVRYMLDNGKTDEQILKATNKPKQWLDKMKTILGLDKETYTSFATGKINQRVALELASMNQADRKICLAKSIEIATARKTEAISKSLEESEVDEQDAYALLDAAESSGKKEDVADAQAKIAAVSKKIEEKKKKVSSIKAKANTTDLEQAKAVVGKQSDDKELTMPKLWTHWYKPMKELVHIAEDDEIPQHEINGVPVALARFVKYLFEEGVKKGERNIEKLLRNYDDEI
jgi:hypothetical protein